MELRVCEDWPHVSERMKYLTRLAKKSLGVGDVGQAIRRLEGCLRLAHQIQNPTTRTWFLFKCGGYVHWRIASCHALLGPDHRGKAIGHLNVVRRYFRRHLDRTGELDNVRTFVYGRALAALARQYNLAGRHDRALWCADEGLDVLYRNEKVIETGAGDLVQMLCYSARGDAQLGLGHCGEAVVRNHEQVLLHYMRHMVSGPDAKEREELRRRSQGHWPWTLDRIHPDAVLERTKIALLGMMPTLPPPMRELARGILVEIDTWREDEPAAAGQRNPGDE